jgi:hypothetical protein
MSAPARLRGLIELRGVGVVAALAAPAPLVAAFDLAAEAERVPRADAPVFVAPGGGEAPLLLARGADPSRIRGALRAILSTSPRDAAG